MSNLILPPLHYFTSLCIPQPQLLESGLCLRALACNSLCKEVQNTLASSVIKGGVSSEEE